LIEASDHLILSSKADNTQDNHHTLTPQHGISPYTMIKTFLTLMIISACLSVHAQYIAPADLLQMNKLWQDNDPHCDRNAYQYLMTVDTNWVPRSKPTVDAKGYISIIGYTRNHKSWYLPFEDQLTLTIAPGTLKKALIYSFTEIDTWNKYNSQMVLMNAVKVGSGPSQGGLQSIYTVNDVGFILVEYPPGINGSDRTYQVTILHND
jgi:hypothetical protein